jgi:predicted lipoprotein with Yx(FWY)xxD motif
MDTNVPTMESTEPSMTESPVATGSAVATESAVATGSPAVTEEGSVGVPVTGPATVKVATLGDYGPALVDGQGMALYLFTEDTQNSGTSACVDQECLEEWPPLLTAGDPVAGEGVDPSLLGTITLSDGTTQVTYNGWPLYYFYTDMAPGEVTGQNDEGVWFLVSPAGDAIK